MDGAFSQSHIRRKKADVGHPAWGTRQDQEQKQQQLQQPHSSQKKA
jgi:hypothetical protein